MITLNVVEESTCNHYTFASLDMYWHGYQLGPAQGVAPVILSLQAPAVSSTLSGIPPNSVGLSQGSLAWGRLRDKSVVHNRVEGTLALAYKRVSYNKANKGFFGFGTPSGHDAILSYPQHVWDGKTYNWSNIPYHVGFSYSGEYLILSTYRGAGDLRINGVLQTPNVLNTSRSIAVYKRVGTSLYKLGAISGTSFQMYTEAEQSAFLASVSGLSGSLTSAITTGITYQTLSGSAEGYFNTLLAGLDSFTPWTDLVPIDDIDWGQLAVECASQLKYVDANVLGLVFDFEDWRHLRTLWKNVANVPGWKKAYRALSKLGSGKGSLLSVRDALKPISSSYLWEKYAVETMVGDLGRLRKGFESFHSSPKPQRLHSRRILPTSLPNSLYAERTAVLTVETSLYPNSISGQFQKWIGEAKKWGVYPQGTNLYDLIPYSFVIDWFVDFGGFVEQVDTYLDQKNYFPIQYCVCSDKVSADYDVTFAVPGTPVTGVVTYSYYDRWIMEELPLPNVALESGSGPIGHGVEAGALLLQRL